MTGIDIIRIAAAISVLFFGLFTFLNNRKSPVNQIFIVLTFSIFIWLVFYTFANTSHDATIVLQFFKLGYIGIIFIPLTFFIFIAQFLSLKIKRSFIALSVIACGTFLLLLCLGSNFIEGLHHYSWGY